MRERKANAERLKELAEELKKGAKKDSASKSSKKSSKKKKSEFEEADKDGDGKISKEELEVSKKKIVEKDDEE